jgi:thiol-disulfide isomerase/thioredoxin
VEEWQMDGDFLRQWNKSITTAVVSGGNRYRFESHDQDSWWTLVSDGKQEWMYNGDSREYTQQPVPTSGPTHFKTAQYRLAFWMNQAQDLIKKFDRWPYQEGSPVFLPDEIVDWNGKKVACMVIEYRRTITVHSPADISYRSRYWIAKDAGVFLKSEEHEEGALISTQPYAHYVSDRRTVYLVTDLDPAGEPESLFQFPAPSTATLVNEFQDPVKAMDHGPELAGKPAPKIEFSSEDGKAVSLQSFLGKPVLIDFWATWCGPCVESIPVLEKIYRQASGMGLVMLSVDEGDQPKIAADYFADHREHWPNFHSTEAIRNAFPHRGIPFLVLLDASGKIVFAKSGFEEAELRAAIAKLGPEFAAVASAGKE